MEDIIYKVFNLETKANDDDRTITAVASYQDSKGDRDGDVVHLDGLNIKQFKKNKGPILWSHDAKQLPVAKVPQVKIDGKNLSMKIQFPTPEEYGFADTIYKLIKGGYINNLSIGFAPDYEKAKYDEKRKGYDFYKSELLETSIVNVPANQHAQIITRSLDNAMSDKVIDKSEADEVKEYMHQLLDGNDVTQEKPEQNTKDDMQSLIDKINNIELRLNDIEKEHSSKNAEKNIYGGLFDDNTDLESKSVDPNTQLIEDALKQLESYTEQHDNGKRQT